MEVRFLYKKILDSVIYIEVIATWKALYLFKCIMPSAYCYRVATETKSRLIGHTTMKSFILMSEENAGLNSFILLLTCIKLHRTSVPINSNRLIYMWYSSRSFIGTLFYELFPIIFSSCLEKKDKIQIMNTVFFSLNGALLTLLIPDGFLL